MSMTELKVSGAGSLQLPLAIRRQIGNEPLQLLNSSPEHMMVARPDADNPVLLAGVLGELAIPDLLSFFNMFRKTGILHFVLEGGTKSLYFHQGEVVYATSTFPEDDLGEVLVSLGKAEREQIGELRERAAKKAILGKMLVESGAIIPRDLWLATRSQVELIVYRLFAVEEGSFYFEAKSLDQEQQLRLSMSTQNLIMEGLRRQDEEALFMRRVISIDYYPVPTGLVPDDLPQGDSLLLSLAEEEALSARDLFRRAGLCEFNGIRTLYGLLEKGVLEMEETQPEKIEGGLGRITAIYNSLFKSIGRRMQQEKLDFRKEVNSLLFQLPQPYSFVLREVEMLKDGSIDARRIVDNLDGLEEGDKEQLLVDSLHELAKLEQEVADTVLEESEARELIVQIEEADGKARGLVGKG